MPACTQEHIASGDEDRAACETLFATLHCGLYRRLRRLGANHSDAEDLAQEALLQTWRRRHHHEDDDHARRYAFAAATTKWIDLLRRTETHVLLRDNFDNVIVDHESPHDAVTRSEERKALAAALAELPFIDRMLLIDAEVHGLDTEELIERYASTAGALRVRRFRARQALRARLEYLRAPMALPAIAGRKLAQAARSASRWLHELFDSLSPNMVGVMITTLSLVASPFGIPLAPMLPAHADNGGSSRSPSGTARRPIEVDRLHPHPTSTQEKAPAITAPIPRSQHRAAPPSPPSPPRLPAVCVGSTCTPGGNPAEPGDVLIVHGPGPVGDREVRQDLVAVCEWTPDSALADCHTEGKPDYRVPLPPRP